MNNRISLLQDFQEILQITEEIMPLVHLISNKVTMADTVNAILAAGGRGICGDNISEVEEVNAISDALLLNIGTPHERTLDTMLKAGIFANKRGIPVVLDPVGVGVSRFRVEIIREILDKVKITCIRGNGNEICTLCNLFNVGAGLEDDYTMLTGDKSPYEPIKALAGILNTIVISTGGTDYVTDGVREQFITGGSEYCDKITGFGCMLSGVIAKDLAAGKGLNISDFEKICRTLRLYKKAAEDAEFQMQIINFAGPGTFKCLFMDKLYEYFYKQA